MSQHHLAALIALTLGFAFGFERACAQPATESGVPTEQNAPAHHHGPPSTLQPGDAFGEELMLPERTILYVRGSSNWETAFETLVKSFKTLHEHFEKQGMKANGPAMIIYTRTDESGFDFEAALPVAEAPANPPTDGIAIGKTPTGKALKFTHRGSFDSMQSTYEAIYDYFDDKDLESKDVLIEEYPIIPTTESADHLVINLFVPIK